MSGRFSPRFGRDPPKLGLFPSGRLILGKLPVDGRLMLGRLFEEPTPRFGELTFGRSRLGPEIFGRLLATPPPEGNETPGRLPLVGGETLGRLLAVPPVEGRETFGRFALGAEMFGRLIAVPPPDGRVMFPDGREMLAPPPPPEGREIFGRDPPPALDRAELTACRAALAPPPPPPRLPLRPMAVASATNSEPTRSQAPVAYLNVAQEAANRFFGCLTTRSPFMRLRNRRKSKDAGLLFVVEANPHDGHRLRRRLGPAIDFFADGLNRDGLIVHARDDLRPAGLATIGQSLADLHNPAIFLGRPGSLAKRAIGVEHPGPDRFTPRIPTNDLRSLLPDARSLFNRIGTHEEPRFGSADVVSTLATRWFRLGCRPPNGRLAIPAIANARSGWSWVTDS